MTDCAMYCRKSVKLVAETPKTLKIGVAELMYETHKKFL
jgi:hypothetical protein